MLSPDIVAFLIATTIPRITKTANKIRNANSNPSLNPAVVSCKLAICPCKLSSLTTAPFSETFTVNKWAPAATPSLADTITNVSAVDPGATVNNAGSTLVVAQSFTPVISKENVLDSFPKLATWIGKDTWDPLGTSLDVAEAVTKTSETAVVFQLIVK